MSIRDFLRLALTVFFVTAIDHAFYHLFGSPLNGAWGNFALAAFVVLIWAIREGQQ